MARTHARILTRIWSNPDFRQLLAIDQRTYILAISQPNITFCGVVPYTAKRWSTFAGDTTPAEIRASAERLQERRYVFVDDDTEELLVRAFPKHDGVLKSPNLITAMSREYDDILSPTLRCHFLQGLPEGFLETLSEGVRATLSEGFTQGYFQAREKGSSRAGARAHGAEPLSPSPSPSPSPTPPDRTELARLIGIRPAVVGAIETEKEKQNIERLAARALDILGPKTKPTAVLDWLWWAATFIDLTVVDELLGYCAGLDQPPSRIGYLTTTLEQWARQRDIDPPPYHRAAS